MRRVVGLRDRECTDNIALSESCTSHLPDASRPHNRLCTVPWRGVGGKLTVAEWTMQQAGKEKSAIRRNCPRRNKQQPKPLQGAALG